MQLPEFFGLDIGSHSIKVCQVNWQGGKPSLVAIGDAITPKGIIGSGNESEQKELAEHINRARKDGGIRTNKVVVGLPEARIFTQLISIPKVEDSKIEELIHWEAKKYIPVPIDEVRVDWIFLGNRTTPSGVELDIFLIAAPNNMIQRYIKVLKFAGLEPIGIETEAIATTRALWWPEQVQKKSREQFSDMSMMLLDFGAKNTDLSVVRKGVLLFSQSLATGSDVLTEALVADFGLEVQQAEEYKRGYGLDASQLGGKIAKSLGPVMKVIVSEARKTLNFFDSRFKKSTPRRLLLVGDGAKLPGILVFMAEGLGLETSRADPFANIEIAKRVQSKFQQVSSVGYCVSLGLALKNG